MLVPFYMIVFWLKTTNESFPTFIEYTTSFSFWGQSWGGIWYLADVIIMVILLITDNSNHQKESKHIKMYVQDGSSTMFSSSCQGFLLLALFDGCHKWRHKLIFHSYSIEMSFIFRSSSNEMSFIFHAYSIIIDLQSINIPPIFH